MNTRGRLEIYNFSENREKGIGSGNRQKSKGIRNRMMLTRHLWKEDMEK